MTNISDPFASDLPVVEVLSPYSKPVGIVEDEPIIPLPFAPSGGYSAHFAANLANAIIAISDTLALSNSNNILTFNSQEVVAMENTYTLLAAIQANSHASPFPFTQAQLQDMFVSLVAVNNSQNSGAYITNGDLANNNVSFVDANTGFFPEGAQTITINDQYGICELPGSGNFYYSNSANLMQWSVLNSFDMESFSDQPLASRLLYGEYVAAFGIQSIEFFQDTGLAASQGTFQAVPATAQQVGLAAVFSIADFMGSVAFLGQYKTGQAHVYLFNNYTPTIISDPDIDTIINGFDVINDATAYAFDSNGHQFYQITFPSAGRSFLYDGTSQQWSETMSGTVTDYGRHVTGLAVTFNGTTLAGDAATGNLYIVDPNNPTDNDFLMKRELDTKHLTLNGNRFTVAQLWLDVNVGSYAGAPVVEQQVSNTTNRIGNLTASVGGGACTYYGYAASSSLGFAGQFGTLTSNSFTSNGVSYNVQAIIMQETNFGQNDSAFIVVVSGATNPPQNAFNSITFTDVKGLQQTYNTNAAVFVSGAPSSGNSQWTWDAIQTGYNSMANAAFSGFLTNAGIFLNYLTLGNYSIAAQANAQIMLYWSTDNGNTWKGPRVKSLGAVGNYATRVVWRSICNARDVVFKFVVTDQVPITFVRGMAVIVPGTG